MLRCIRPDFILIDLTVNGFLAFRTRHRVHSSVLLSQTVIFFDLPLFNYLPSTGILTVTFSKHVNKYCDGNEFGNVVSTVCMKLDVLGARIWSRGTFH